MTEDLSGLLSGLMRLNGDHRLPGRLDGWHGALVHGLFWDCQRFRGESELEGGLTLVYAWAR